MYALEQFGCSWLFFFRWPSLFFPDFFCDFFGCRGFRVCMYACAHVFPPYFSLMPNDTFVGIVLMMEPILKKEHHHPQKRAPPSSKKSTTMASPIVRSSGMAMVIKSHPPPETPSRWVGRGLIRRILFNFINRPRK